ncbi:alpha/beta hydrolase [Pseudothioclava nitratireducens]|uniref:alpha/beta hydrolase n=1 Tax=Pseudothioclava nitratireducens TaxID=1928646 RepID=UPI0023DC19F8|nr:alpha/beta hydrolase fold domain-containing protein [Defluviimonas nitratireducens]MDF1620836.1 alpha/beta fold hydrolase [Defluviimonas nitratireducens]
MTDEIGTYAAGSGITVSEIETFPEMPTHRRKFLLCFHGGGGIGGNPLMHAPFLESLGREQPLTAWLPNYRTYRTCGPTTDVADMIADARHALSWARGSLPEGARLDVCGASFGGFLALSAVLADPRSVSGLLLLNPVTDTGPGGFSNRVLSPDHAVSLSPLSLWKNSDLLQELNCLIVHGEADVVVPAEQSRRFAALWPPERCRLVTFPGRGHGFFNRGSNHAAVVEAILKHWTLCDADSLD